MEKFSDTDSINYIVAYWPLDKQDEVYAVKKLLDNAGIDFQFSPQNIEAYPDEPADIWVKDIDRKFQIVVGDFQHYELMGNTKAINGVKFINMPPRTIEVSILP